MFGKKKYENMTQAEKLHYTMVKRFGSEEAYAEYIRWRGGKGGRKKAFELKSPKGFAANKELARIAGAKGGAAKAKK